MQTVRHIVFVVELATEFDGNIWWWRRRKQNKIKKTTIEKNTNSMLQIHQSKRNLLNIEKRKKNIIYRLKFKKWCSVQCICRNRKANQKNSKKFGNKEMIPIEINLLIEKEQPFIFIWNDKCLAKKKRCVQIIH